MPGAISVKAMGESAQPIRDLWSWAGHFEETPSMTDLGYPPHFTFAIYDSVDTELLNEVVRNVFSGQPKLHIRFNGLRCFDVSPLVLWAAPEDASELRRLHKLIHGQIDPAQCREHYRPGAWVPHCTLATKITESNCAWARSRAAEPIEPFTVKFDAADVVTFPPITVVREIELT